MISGIMYGKAANPRLNGPHLNISTTGFSRPTATMPSDLILNWCSPRTAVRSERRPCNPGWINRSSGVFD